MIVEMRPGGRDPGIQQALFLLGQVRTLLASPKAEAVEMCVPLLQETLDLIRRVEDRLNGSTTADSARLRHEINRLKQELGVVSGLMTQAAEYYLGIAQLLGLASAGYSRSGETPFQQSGSRLVVRG
jgi:hypothetical protein